MLDRVVELARPWPDAVALDVATGTGHTAFALAPHVRQVIAADITPEMLREGSRLKDELGIENVEFRIADAHELPFEDERFDSVTCRRAAHHFGDIERALREMRRVLKRAGRLVIDDRSVPEDDFVDVTMNRLDWLHDESHVREYRPSEWARLLPAAGFDVEAIEPYTKHRPLSSLTAHVDSARVAQIHAVIASLDQAQRVALNVVEQAGETYTQHWYVMAVGVKRDA
ncbi:MAG TPA: methyltransferase domain-containing protein [Anaerolineae bacterium]|nr:methyltransferase domain-containing protein [Anaerolineae bacterium]